MNWIKENQRKLQYFLEISYFEWQNMKSEHEVWELQMLKSNLKFLTQIGMNQNWHESYIYLETM